MKVIKKINNNVALALDGNGKELVAMGKGIGFPEMPYEVTDLSSITKTFYSIDDSLIGLFSEISEEIFDVSFLIVENAKNVLKSELNPNLVVSLADHINFAITRLTKYKSMKMLFSYEVENLYPIETKLGKWSVKQINKALNVSLPDSEITNIALHFIHAQEEAQTNINDGTASETVIDNVVKMVEDYFKTNIDKDSFSYNRFTSHIRFLLIRVGKDEQFIKDEGLFEIVKEKYPDIYKISCEIAKYLAEVTKVEISESEQLYLMIHLQRVISKDSNVSVDN